MAATATGNVPVYRYVKGLADQTKVLAPASQEICNGDLLFSIPSGGSEVACNIASNYTWSTSLGLTQTNFSNQFLGVANDNRMPTDSTTNQRILVQTRGIFDYPCASLSSAAPIGSYVSPAQGTGTELANQTLAVTVATGSTAAGAIGRVVEFAPSGATVLRVELQSTQMLGHIQ